MLIECKKKIIILCLVIQALELNETNTKALFRRAQAWQGLKEYSKALVTSAQASLSLKRNIQHLNSWISAGLPASLAGCNLIGRLNNIRNILEVKVTVSVPWWRVHVCSVASLSIISLTVFFSFLSFQFDLKKAQEITPDDKGGEFAFCVMKFEIKSPPSAILNNSVSEIDTQANTLNFTTSLVLKNTPSLHKFHYLFQY